MALQTQRVTIEQFDKFIRQPDLGDSIYELIGGEIVEKESSPFASALAATISTYFVMHVRAQNRIGHVTGAAGGYYIANECYVPDMAYVSKKRLPELSRTGYDAIAPEIVVEVIFDEQSVNEYRKLIYKITNYLAAGTTVWVVYPFSQMIDVHAPGQPVKRIGIDGTLDGGDILPEFKLPLRDVFQSEN